MHIHMNFSEWGEEYWLNKVKARLVKLNYHNCIN